MLDKLYGTQLLHFVRSVFVAPGSGGIISSAADFIRYLTFWLNDGRIGSEQIVPEVKFYCWVILGSLMQE